MAGCDPRMALLCRFLARVSINNLLWMPEISTLLAQLRPSCSSLCHIDNPDNLLQICVLVFTVANGCPLSKEQQIDLLNTLAQASSQRVVGNETRSLDPWIVYQLACKATLHRQPHFAAELFEQLASLVSQMWPIFHISLLHHLTLFVLKFH